MARRHAETVPLAELARRRLGRAATPGWAGRRWSSATCRGLAGFDPDIRHRTADATVSLALVGARHGSHPAAGALILPDRHPAVAVRDIAENGLSRTIFAATRTTDGPRPSTSAVLAAVRAAAAAVTRP